MKLKKKKTKQQYIVKRSFLSKCEHQAQREVRHRQAGDRGARVGSEI